MMTLLLKKWIYILKNWRISKNRIFAIITLFIKTADDRAECWQPGNTFRISEAASITCKMPFTCPKVANSLVISLVTLQDLVGQEVSWEPVPASMLVISFNWLVYEAYKWNHQPIV